MFIYLLFARITPHPSPAHSIASGTDYGAKTHLHVKGVESAVFGSQIYLPVGTSCGAGESTPADWSWLIRGSLGPNYGTVYGGGAGAGLELYAYRRVHMHANLAIDIDSVGDIQIQTSFGDVLINAVGTSLIYGSSAAISSKVGGSAQVIGDASAVIQATTGPIIMNAFSDVTISAINVKATSSNMYAFAYFITSSQRIKRDIRELDGAQALTTISALEPRYISNPPPLLLSYIRCSQFRYNGHRHAGNRTDGSIGFIAEQVASVMPLASGSVQPTRSFFNSGINHSTHPRRTMVNPTPPTTATNLTESVPDGDPLPTVNLTPIVSTAVAAIKELALIVQRLTSRVAELEAKLAAAR